MLVILESPGKIKKMKKILGSGYRVAASVGHICDLDPKALSIDIGEDSFIPLYKTLGGKQKVITSLKKEVFACDHNVLLATDQDREGEFIAHSLREVLGLQNPRRIRFNQITYKAIHAALQDPGYIDENLVLAQKARRVMDRLVGYMISPLLGKGRSAGRVQSVVVKMILGKQKNMEEALEKGVEKVVSVQGTFESPEITGVMIRPTAPSTRQEMEQFLHMLFSEETAHFSITDVTLNEETRNPPPPYTTSSLQQESWVKIRLSSEKTMSAAQKLYEAGHITYHRTDSTAVAPEAVQRVKELVNVEYGTEYSSPRYWGTSRGTEAHEAIRVTDPFFKGDDLVGMEARLYALIWSRTIQSQMSAAVFETQKLLLERSGVVFESSQRRVVFPGYLIISKEKDESPFQSVNVGKKYRLLRAECRERLGDLPSRFQESSLIREMERLCIGRPSTYASILKLIQARGYVRVVDFGGVPSTLLSVSCDVHQRLDAEERVVNAGSEKKRFEVTQIGKEITVFLEKHYPQLMDPTFTASMEANLDQVAKGEVSWQSVIGELYQSINHNPPPAQPSSGGVLLGEQNGKRFTYLPSSTYSPCIRVDYGDGAVSFVTVPEDHRREITLDDAAAWSAKTRYLGNYRKTAVFVIEGRYGYYLKHGKKRIPLKDHGDISFDMAKKVIKA